MNIFLNYMVEFWVFFCLQSCEGRFSWKCERRITVTSKHVIPSQERRINRDLILKIFKFRHRIFQIRKFNIQTSNLTRLRQSVRSFRIKFNVSCTTDLSGVMDTLIFLMSSDAVGEINFASFHPGFISAGAWKFIGKTNVMINEKWKRKREREREKRNMVAI